MTPSTQLPFRKRLSSVFLASTYPLLTHSTPWLLLQIYKEETFGPAVPLFKFKHDEEAIKLANDTIYGLASYFYTRVRPAGP